MAQRTISGAELRAETTTLERAVIAAGLATDSELEAWKPGGEKNSRTDARGYLTYFARLHRFHARGENQINDDARMRADAAGMAALRDEPIRVDLIEPVTIMGPEGTAHVVDSLMVYQKSLDALLQAHSLDRQLAWLIFQRDRVDQAGAVGMPRAGELMNAVTDAIAYTYQLLCWIMTSPGPASPLVFEYGIDPIPPDYVKALHPIDVNQIARAGMEHHARLAAVQMLLDKRNVSESGKRPTWSQFVGSLAVAVGPDSVHISRYRSLGSLLATVLMDSESKRVDDPAATNPAQGNHA